MRFCVCTYECRCFCCFYVHFLDSQIQMRALCFYGLECFSVCDKGCIVYLSNVRVPDNATPVSRLAVMVAMATLANRSRGSGLSFSSPRGREAFGD